MSDHNGSTAPHSEEKAGPTPVDKGKGKANEPTDMEMEDDDDSSDEESGMDEQVSVP